MVQPVAKADVPRSVEYVLASAWCMCHVSEHFHARKLSMAFKECVKRRVWVAKTF